MLRGTRWGLSDVSASIQILLMVVVCLLGEGCGPNGERPSRETEGGQESRETFKETGVTAAQQETGEIGASQSGENLLPSEIQELLNVLAMAPWEEKERKGELDKAIDRLAAAGDISLEAIMTKFNQHGTDLVFRQRSVRVFEKMKTPNGRKVLLDIALGNTHFKEHDVWGWAARAYVRSLEDKSQAAKLLVSDRSDVQNAALLAMKGVSLGPDLLHRLKDLLASPVNAVRWSAARVLGADPGDKFTREKVEMIVGAIERVIQLPNAEQRYPRSSLTHAEVEWHVYIQVLKEMPSADAALKEATAETKGVTRKCLLLARGQRGDRSALGGIRDIIQDPDAGMLRAWAALTLGHLGSEKDIPTLKRIAASDPLKRQPGGCPPPPGHAPEMFPVRAAARRAIANIEKRENQ